MTIDTLAAAKTLAKAGMENGQAEAVANVVRDATADLATKADLDALESRLDGRFAAMDGRFAAMDDKFAAMDDKFAAMDDKLTANERSMAERFAINERSMAERFTINERVTAERLTANERGTADRIVAAETRLHAELKSGLAELRADFYKWMWVMGSSIVGILLTTITLSFGVAAWLFG